MENNPNTLFAPVFESEMEFSTREVEFWVLGVGGAEARLKRYGRTHILAAERSR